MNFETIFVRSSMPGTFLFVTLMVGAAGFLVRARGLWAQRATTNLAQTSS